MDHGLIWHSNSLQKKGCRSGHKKRGNQAKRKPNSLQKHLSLGAPIHLKQIHQGRVNHQKNVRLKSPNSQSRKVILYDSN